jgi:hypothetical protein
MDIADPLAFPRRSDDPLQADLTEVDVAIELIRRHVARRIRLAALVAPERVASVALAHAQAAGVDFRMERDGDHLTLAFGGRPAGG